MACLAPARETAYHADVKNSNQPKKSKCLRAEAFRREVLCNLRRKLKVDEKQN